MNVLELKSLISQVKKKTFPTWILLVFSHAVGDGHILQTYYNRGDWNCNVIKRSQYEMKTLTGKCPDRMF